MLMIDWLNIDMNRINFSIIDKEILLNFFQSENLNNLKKINFLVLFKGRAKK
jgi:hypothetical protein